MIFSPQLPFAEVLGSELLLTRFSFSSFQGRVLARFFLARLFELGFQKRCKGVHYVDIGESFPTSYSNEYLLAKFGFDTAENEHCKNSNFLTFLTPEFLIFFVLTRLESK